MDGHKQENKVPVNKKSELKSDFKYDISQLNAKQATEEPP